MPSAFQFPDEDDAARAADDSQGTESEILTESQEVEVEIIDDVPEADRNRRPLDKAVDDPSDEEITTYSTKVQARIKDLTHARHDERRRADQLQRERDELDRYARAVTEERDRMKQNALTGANIVTQQAATMASKALLDAKARLKAAHEAFDTDAIVDAQEEMNNAQMRMTEVKNIRQNAVQQQRNEVESPRTAPAPAPAPVLDGRTSTWMARNKWFGAGGDEELTGYALGLHQKLVNDKGEGYTRTDEYYSQIDAAMRQTFPAKFGRARAQGSSVAPASRTSVGGKRVVQLTATALATAKRMGLTPQQYAAEVVKMEK